MADLIMILVFVAFIAMCVLYVAWCDHIIGPDPVRTEPDAAARTTTEVAA